MNLDSLALARLDELEGDHLKPILDRVGHQTRVRPWNRCGRVCLANQEESFDLAEVVLDLVLGSAPFSQRHHIQVKSVYFACQRNVENYPPDEEKVGVLGLVTE